MADSVPFRISQILTDSLFRFLLADDAGAGKTIMAGLLIRELKLRGLAERALIICPANLTFQWQRELKEKFDEKFLALKGGKRPAAALAEERIGGPRGQPLPSIESTRRCCSRPAAGRARSAPSSKWNRSGAPTSCASPTPFRPSTRKTARRSDFSMRCSSRYLDEQPAMKPRPITNYVISGHATFEMNRRGLTEEAIRAVLSGPEQELPVRPGRVILQSRMPLGSPENTYLIRILLDIDRHPPEVVTAYRTSKIAKYWREEQ